MDTKMASKKHWLAIALILGLVLTGCATISKENHGTFQTIPVPAKDFVSLGLVFTENVISNNRGQVFTYYELLRQANNLGADAIVNVTIDVKREAQTFLGIRYDTRETWYGAATAIKYVEGILSDVTTNSSGDTTITREVVIMAGGSGSRSSESSSPSTFVWYNPTTWFN